MCVSAKGAKKSRKGGGGGGGGGGASSKTSESPTPAVKVELGILPQEKGKLQSLFEFITKEERGDGKGLTREDKGKIFDAKLTILREHPFVRAKSKQTIGADNPLYEHAFDVYGFSCDVWKFRKWLRGKDGRPYLKLAGGPSDDGLYTLSAMIRKILPRGLHYVEATHKKKLAAVPPDATEEERPVPHKFWFRGIPKFTGLVASDEDESSNSHESTASFFYRGKTLKEAVSFAQTLKSNGENAKLSLRILDDVLYLLAGSKNTCLVWPGAEPSTKFYRASAPTALDVLATATDLETSTNRNDEHEPAANIARIFSEWFLASDAAKRRAFVDAFRKREFATIMAEVNRPWGEHLLPIRKLYMECFSILCERDGLPLPPHDVFDFFKAHGLDSYDPSDEKDSSTKQKLYHVPFAVHPMSALEARVRAIRKGKESEGAVLYLCDDEKHTIGLVKVKATDYVVRRRLRESLANTLLKKLSSGAILGYPTSVGAKKAKEKDYQSVGLDSVLKKIRTALPAKMANLTHVPNYKEDSPAWGRYAVAFLDWWIETRLYRSRGGKTEKKSLDEWTAKERVAYGRIFLEWRRHFGSLLAAFDNFCDEA
eukprot:g2212.t1